MLFILLTFLQLSFEKLYSWSLNNGISSRYYRKPLFSMHFEEALENNALANELLRPERYIATNRFKVRKNSGPKFEKRWADRKSRVAQLPGFRFFTLLKRVEEFGVNYSNEGDLGNYISLTVWENKDNFDAWRTGDAFKEAHGGGGITDFIQLLTTAIFILDGGPKPAFYDAILPINGETLNIENVEGWRKVTADGVNFLDPEIFLAQNRYSVKPGNEVEFETNWRNRDKQSLINTPGFLGFFIQRRAALKPDDSFNYIETSLWKKKENFESWFNAFREQLLAKNGSSDGKAGNALILNAPPQPAFYEGKLALSSASGI
jgi:heme-degrading monooxygenase HmoA